MALPNGLTKEQVEAYVAGNAPPETADKIRKAIVEDSDFAARVQWLMTIRQSKQAKGESK